MIIKETLPPLTKIEGGLIWGNDSYVLHEDDLYILCKIRITLIFENYRYAMEIPLTKEEFYKSKFSIGVLGEKFKDAFKQIYVKNLLSEEEYLKITYTKSFKHIVNSLTLIHAGNNLKDLKKEEFFKPLSDEIAKMWLIS